jgi:hypothetical protein
MKVSQWTSSTKQNNLEIYLKKVLSKRFHFRQYKKHAKTYPNYGTRQTMYIKHNLEAGSFNHCCNGKEISSKYFRIVHL